MRRALLCVLLILVARPARADDDDEAFARAHRRRSFAVDANPFGLLVGHYSVDVQVVSAQGHALVVNPYLQYVVPDFDVSPDNRMRSGYGVELAYRYYSGDRGPNGFFAGVGLIAAREHLDENPPVSPAQTHPQLGALVDVGVQGVLDSGLLIGGGLGIAWTHDTDTSNVKGIFQPRVLCSVGYAF
jgi:hypothetical protein